MYNLKSVLITGATGAIGNSIARLIAEREGYQLTILARDESKDIKTTAQLIKETGNHSISYIICDLSRKNQIIETARNWNGPLHILINDAGTTPRTRLETHRGLAPIATVLCGEWGSAVWFLHAGNDPGGQGSAGP